MPASTASADPSGTRAGRVSRVLAWLRAFPYTFGLALAAVTFGGAWIASIWLGRAIVDPEGFLGPSYVRLPLMVLGFSAADVIPRALHRGFVRSAAPGGSGGVRAAVARGWGALTRFVPDVRAILREQWSWARLAYISAGVVSFYGCYIGYRNLKSYLPLVRETPGSLQDHWMIRLDHIMAFGNYPDDLLYAVLGTGVMAQVLSVIYISYLMLIPVTLAIMLVFSNDISRGAWYATALSLNWVLGVASYYLIPTLGPAFYQPQNYDELVDTGVTSLQQSLFSARSDFQTDLADPTSMQGIAGFASLHVSVTFTAALFFSRIGAHRWVRVVTWTYFWLTVVATIYFGWHYLLDDIGGVAIGWAAVSLGAIVTGNGRDALRAKEARAVDDEATGLHRHDLAGLDEPVDVPGVHSGDVGPDQAETTSRSG